MALTSRVSIGARLRQARTDRGVDLDRVAAVTGIDRGILEALERDASPEELHGPVYARIFLREYARHLGLNPKPLVGAYRTAHPEPERPLIGGPTPVDRRPARWLKPGLVLLSVATLGTLVVMGARQESRPTPLAPGEMGPAPATAGSPSPTPSPAAEPARGLHLVIRVVEASSWVRVARGEEVLLGETLEPGSVRAFRAPRELDLVLGYAPAVRLTANETRLGLPEDVTVYSASVVLRDGGPRLAETG
jgi:cytoskeleton protein RodZ